MKIAIYIVIVETGTESNDRGYCGCTNKTIDSVWFNRTKAQEQANKRKNSYVEEQLAEASLMEMVS